MPPETTPQVEFLQDLFIEKEKKDAKRHSELMEMFGNLEQRVRKVERTQDTQAPVVAGAKRVVWLGVGAIMMGMGAALFKPTLLPDSLEQAIREQQIEELEERDG